MKMVGLLVACMAVATACTGSGGETTTSGIESTTTVAPLTTLSPQSTTTTTAAPQTTTTTEPVRPNDCTPTGNTSRVPYTQACVVLDIQIMATEDVDPDALTAMSERIYNMLIERPDLTAAFLGRVGARVIGQDERLTDLPEFTDLYDQYPGTDWNRAGRSFPGTDLVPYVAGAEENLLCLPDDRYEGEDMFIRDFALAIRRFGMFTVDQSTNARIEQAYSTAIARGLWENTIAEINSDEYWAEGSQSYFDANLEEPDDRPPNSAHNQVDTRDELRRYDTDLYNIARSVYGDTDWRPCAAE